MAAIIFLPAWTFDYWQGWIFLTVLSASVLAITIYLMKNDPKLLERRTNAGPGAEQQRSQNVIQSLAAAAFVAMFVVSALDHRFAWSTVPLYVSALGDILVALGLYFVFLVFKENTFAAGTIEVGTEQKVIATGPYAIVRHPMYIGALVMLVGVPLALGSWWGLFAIVPMTLVIVWRLLDEERFLAKNLAGYKEYQGKVKSRLLPLIW
ncbi:MAG TPA: isoprenylcysteine carboxylmethyltransferase family protein [Candidatus Binatus sp.]|uniref:methyltransferase family protein n=1 Tax=Candidatus Binatus sp. TaxID=2811406 RepID=UPI002B47352B|nr:isoprenylcysteine carboxylmethyltransferase family protein [Candidatus Binatus sp.]HKN13786.1 isoprenylcysteine carboxylmethyltransferase family protein [Candidatus Binatus sp.]